MEILKDSRQVPVNRRLTPCVEIVLGHLSRKELIELVWAQAEQMARGLLMHKDFVVTSEPQRVHIVTLGWTAFNKSVPLEDLDSDKLFDRDYMAEWSKRQLNGQQIVPCEAEDAVQLWAQHIMPTPLDESDMFGENRPWSSMRPLPEPYGMRFFLTRSLCANQYGVGNISASNIFHHQFGSILYRLIDV
jgi:hypothetical protein